jgi:hypothetical protein
MPVVWNQSGLVQSASPVVGVSCLQVLDFVTESLSSDNPCVTAENQSRRRLLWFEGCSRSVSKKHVSYAPDVIEIGLFKALPPKPNLYTIQN